MQPPRIDAPGSAYGRKPTQVLFDTEFTSLFDDPGLLSIGLVTLDGRECYAELDLASPEGRERLLRTGWDVREGVIADKWGLLPEAVCPSDESMGRRAGDWLLEVAESDPGGRIELLYDYPLDREFLVEILEAADLWPRIQTIASMRNVVGQTCAIGPTLAAEACYRALRLRNPPLHRHHALADALALRSAWRTWRFVHERAADFAVLLAVVGASEEGWLCGWLAAPALALDHQVPLDVLDQPEGVQRVEEALLRIQHGCA